MAKNPVVFDPLQKQCGAGVGDAMNKSALPGMDGKDVIDTSSELGTDRGLVLIVPGPGDHRPPVDQPMLDRERAGERNERGFHKPSV